MEKIDLVEYAYQNGEEIVFMVGNKIWVCFDGVEFLENGEIQFKGCSEAWIDNNEEYYGDVKNGSYDVYLRISEPTCEYFVPTRFKENELVEIIKII